MLHKKIIKELLTDFVNDCNNGEYDNIKELISDPIINYLMDKMYPYLFVSVTILILLILLLFIILFIVLKKQNK